MNNINRDPLNDQLNEFDCYRSYSVTDYGQNYFKVTKKYGAFPCSSILFSIISEPFSSIHQPTDQEPKNCSDFEGFSKWP